MILDLNENEYRVLKSVLTKTGKYLKEDASYRGATVKSVANKIKRALKVQLKMVPVRETADEIKYYKNGIDVKVFVRGQAGDESRISDILVFVKDPDVGMDRKSFIAFGNEDGAIKKAVEFIAGWLKVA